MLMHMPFKHNVANQSDLETVQMPVGTDLHRFGHAVFGYGNIYDLLDACTPVTERCVNKKPWTLEDEEKAEARDDFVQSAIDSLDEYAMVSEAIKDLEAIGNKEGAAIVAKAEKTKEIEQELADATIKMREEKTAENPMYPLICEALDGIDAYSGKEQSIKDANDEFSCHLENMLRQKKEDAAQ
jgi:hypothetical protein